MTEERLNVEEELSSCPKCRASGGFHISLRKSRGRLEVLLVCPSCRGRFAVGGALVPETPPREYDPALDDGP